MADLIKEKYLLLDTNVIINAAKFTESFRPFFDDLRAKNVRPAVDEVIRYEFLRSSDTRNSLMKKQLFLNGLLGKSSERLVLDVRNSIFIEAKKISAVCRSRDRKNQTSALDFLICAQLKKYSKNVLLATQNNSHFFLPVLRRVKIYTLDTGAEILNIGIYAFHVARFEQMEKNFLGITDKDIPEKWGDDF